jgi:hypothetical protein
MTLLLICTTTYSSFEISRTNFGIAARLAPADFARGKIVTSFDRRTVIVSMVALAAASLFDRQTLAQSAGAMARPAYRGFTVDGTVVTFVVSPDEARVRCHFDVPTEERHRL